MTSFDLDMIVQRIRQQCPRFADVGLSADASAVSASMPVPGAYVIPGTERPQVERDGMAVEYDVRIEFGVIINARNYRVASRGAEQLDGIRALRLAVRDALVRWAPEGATRTIEWIAGDILAFDQSSLRWMDQFSAQFQFTIVGA